MHPLLMAPLLFINGENLTDVRQTRWSPLLRPTRGADGRWTVDAWAPLAMQPQLRPQSDLADDPWLWAFGRLRTGTTRDAARTELTSIIATPL